MIPRSVVYTVRGADGQKNIDEALVRSNSTRATASPTEEVRKAPRHTSSQEEPHRRKKQSLRTPPEPDVRLLNLQVTQATARKKISHRSPRAGVPAFV